MTHRVQLWNCYLGGFNNDSGNDDDDDDDDACGLIVCYTVTGVYMHTRIRKVIHGKQKYWPTTNN